MAKGGKGKSDNKPVNGSDDADLLDQTNDAGMINGGDGDDVINGGSGVDDIRAGDGDDTVSGGTGDDTMFGNDGTDTAVFSGSVFDYTFSTGKGNSWIVSGADGTDTLKHFEFLQFGDYTVDLTANNAPFTRSDEGTTDEDSSVDVAVLDNDWDFEGDAMTVTAVSGGGAGAISTDGTNVTFDASGAYDNLNVGHTATETVTYTVTDAQGDSRQDTVTITITGVNDGPTVAGPVTGSGDEDNGFSVDLLAGASDVDDGAILNATSVILSGDVAGASVNGNNIDIDPAGYQYLAVGETATVTVTYDVTDEHGASVAQSATITIAGVNDAPEANGTGILGGVEEDGTLVATGTVSATDVDASDVLTWSGGGAGAYGDLTIDANGNWTYSLDNAAAQSLGATTSVDETFVVEVSDGNGGTDTETITVSVAGENDDPVIASGATAAAGEDGTLTAGGTLSATDIDVGDTLTWSGGGSSAYGDLSIDASGNWSYTLDNASSAVQSLGADDSVVDSFTVQVDDGQGGTDTATVSINVQGANDAPEITAADSAGSVTELPDGDAGEGTATLSDSGTISFGDVDNGATHTASVAAGGSGYLGSMTATVTAAGTVEWGFSVADSALEDLNDGDSLTQTYTVSVTDEHGASDSQSVTITLNGADDPVAKGGGLAFEHLEAGSDVGITVYGNSSSTSAWNEPYTASQGAQSFGYNTSFTSATDAASMDAFLADKEALVITEHEGWGGIPSGIQGSVESFVAEGGTLVVMGSSGSKDLNFMNQTFGWSLSQTGGFASSEFNPDQAVGTVFEDNGSSLGANSAIYEGLTTSSLPEDSLSIYNFTGNDNQTSVAVMGHGAGQVTFLAWDWFNAQPAGGADNGWLEVYKDALSTPGGLVAPDGYAGVLEAGTTQSGQVPSAGGYNSPSFDHSDYWLFEAEAGATITIDVDRTEFNLDPAMWIFSGEVDPGDLGTTIDWGDPGFVAFADDTTPHPGPYGDPLYSFTVTESGTYTAIVTDFASGSDGGDGVYDYTISYII